MNCGVAHSTGKLAKIKKICVLLLEIMSFNQEKFLQYKNNRVLSSRLKDPGFSGVIIIKHLLEAPFTLLPCGQSDESIYPRRFLCALVFDHPEWDPQSLVHFLEYADATPPNFPIFCYPQGEESGHRDPVSPPCVPKIIEDRENRLK